MQLTICTYNLENFFITMDQQAGDDLESLTERQWQKQAYGLTANKSLQKIKAIAGVLNDIDADIYMLTEVGGRHSLEAFVQYFSSHPYDIYTQESNSDRGIDLAYLVKKGLPFRFDLITHKKAPIPFKGKTVNFSRDLLQLNLSLNNNLFLQLYLVHLKSHLDKKHNDPWGHGRRKAELEKVVEIYCQKKRPHIPVILAGDFNGQAGRKNTGQEFLQIYTKTDLEDILEILNVPEKERFTHIYLSAKPHARLNQLDFMFLSKEIQNKVISDQSYVYYYDNIRYSLPNIPTHSSFKTFLPSDHLPLVGTFSF